MQWNRQKTLAACLLLPFLFNGAATAQTAPATPPAVQQPAASTVFNQLVQSIRQEALNRGVSPATINRVLNHIQPVPGLEKLENYQPEHVKTYVEYMKSTVTQARINKGRQLLAQHGQVLAKIERDYGVPAQYIVAIWALESNYGQNTGNHDIIPALVTLAEIGKTDKRRAYFREEAIQAMRILDQGYNQIVDRKGSWAGAFGQTQFMPSSFLRYAADGDGDGRKDVWNNLSDIFASTANYLARHNWKAGERWGREVRLPANFSKALLTDRLADQTLKTPDGWAKIGVTLPDGSRLPSENTMQAMIIAPDGLGGPTYMVYNNFKTIMRYNSSYKYALAVSKLGDAIAIGRKPVTLPKPASAPDVNPLIPDPL